jgi:phosphate-selective porin OprO/OprP
MERLQLGTHMQMQERSAIGDALNAVRNVGITINGTAFNKRTSWVIGVFNNWFESNDKFNESSTQVIGRVTGLLWISEDESNLFHLGFGYRFDNGKDLIRYQASPEFNQSPVFVDTDTIYASASNTINIEFTWREGPFWISAEFLNNGNISNTMNDPRFTGFNISGSWVLTKEMRKYNRRNGTIGGVPVARAINQGGPGAWEITTRYSNIDLNDTNVAGGEMDIISFGLNWWPTTTFGLNLNYRSIILERFEITGRSSGLMARVVLVLE